MLLLRSHGNNFSEEPTPFSSPNVAPERIRVALAEPIEEAMEIDPQLPIPLYFQLKTLLLEEILSGRYDREERLPTEHELCDRYRISRTPVTRALSELADEGVILRHRRRGSFVNPHWLSRRPDQTEIRVIVPTEGPWARMVRDAAAGSNQISVVQVPGHALHHTLTHAVAEGLAPDIALLDNVWAPEFAAAGFIYALEDLNESWVVDEHEVDFLAPLVRVNRYGGRTFGVSPFADVAGLWYRRDDLESLGLEPPATWNDLRTVGRAFAEAGVRSPIVMPGGSLAGEATAYFLIAFLASNGAQVLGPEGVTLGSPATAQALRFLRSLVEEGLVPLDVVGYEWNETIRLLADRTRRAELRRQLRRRGPRGGAGSASPRGVGPLRIRARACRAAGQPGERRGRDDVRRLPSGRPAGAGHAPRRANGRAGDPRPLRALERPHALAALGHRARRARRALPVPHGGAARGRRRADRGCPRIPVCRPSCRRCSKRC